MMAAKGIFVGVLASALTVPLAAAPVGAADYPPKGPTECSISALSNQRVRVSISPKDNPAGFSFRLERRTGSSWTKLAGEYKTSPPSMSRVVSVQPGIYRALCLGGAGYLNSTSGRATVLETASVVVVTPPKKPQRFVTGRYKTLIKRVEIKPRKNIKKYKKPKYRVLAKPLQPSATGDVSYITYLVTGQGGLRVRVFGDRTVQVKAIITIEPKAEYRETMGPVTQRYSWTLKPA